MWKNIHLEKLARKMKNPAKMLKTIRESSSAISELVEAGIVTVKRKRGGLPTIMLTDKGKELIANLKRDVDRKIPGKNEQTDKPENQQ